MVGIETGMVLARTYFVGVDLGQARDPSAVAVLERAELAGEWDAVAFAYRKEFELRLRRLGRLPLGLKYPEVEERVTLETEAVGRLGVCELVVDATGVGRAVVDHLLADGGLCVDRCRVRAVMVTPGQTERSEGGYDYVPKRELMAVLQTSFEFGELKIARTLRHAAALQKEMAEMRVKVTPAGNEQYGAWRQGEHDDLVFAVALACWGAKRRYPKKPTGVDAYWIGRRR